MKKIIRRRELLADPAVFPELHPVLARIYAARGIGSRAELERTLQGLHPPRLKGLETALDLLEAAIRQQQRLLVIGDFDADGATSTALAVLVLTAMGARHVDYLVPNRFEYGYGLTPEIVAVAIRDKAPDLIITVDNGISSFEGVAAAQAQGVRVLVTDHHLPGESLPAADAIVNPNQPGCDFPSKNLAGVGVVFYLLSALRARLRETGWFGSAGLPVPAMADYLDIVALGTVADVVPLDHNNRILVHQGLARIRAGHCRPGISALLKVGRRRAAALTATDLAFVVAPRLNAAGRLDDMSHGIECLLTTRADQADLYAQELDAMNAERRDIEQGMQQEAMHVLSQLSLDPAKVPYAITLFDRHWHQGVIGILAGRIKERFHRPTIIFAPAEPLGYGQLPRQLKGSARSIPGVHVRDVLDYVAAQNPGLITKFGGHAMAAGLTIDFDRLEQFRAAFDTAVGHFADQEALEPAVFSDGELDAAQCDESLAGLLREAGPWGQSFPEPLFDGEFICLEQKLLQERHLKMTVCHPGSNRPLDAIMFNVDRQQWPNRHKRVRMAYRLDINEFRGIFSLQLRVEYMEPIAV